MMDTVIYAYTLDQAIEDGVLHIVGHKGGQPLVVTRGVLDDVLNEEIRQVFGEFLTWQREVEPGLAEADRMFSRTASNGKTLWVIDDGSAITMLYPNEY